MPRVVAPVVTCSYAIVKFSVHVSLIKQCKTFLGNRLRLHFLLCSDNCKISLAY